MPLSILKFVLILTVSLCLASCATNTDRIWSPEPLETAEKGMLPHERLTESNLLNFITYVNDNKKLQSSRLPYNKYLKAAKAIEAKYNLPPNGDYRQLVNRLKTLLCFNNADPEAYIRRSYSPPPVEHVALFKKYRSEIQEVLVKYDDLEPITETEIKEFIKACKLVEPHYRRAFKRTEDDELILLNYLPYEASYEELRTKTRISRSRFYGINEKIDYIIDVKNIKRYSEVKNEDIKCYYLFLISEDENSLYEKYKDKIAAVRGPCIDAMSSYVGAYVKDEEAKRELEQKKNELEENKPVNGSEAL